MKHFPMLAVCGVLALGACGLDVASPGDGGTWVIRVDVSGGFAAVEYTFDVQGDGAVVGVRCGRGCGFQAGDTLARLTPAQRDAVEGDVAAAGLPDPGQTRDFGTECCDQFAYAVTYTSGNGVRSFTGTSEALPEPLRALVRTLHLLYQDTPPLIMSQTTGLDGFVLDGLTIFDARAEAGVLEVDVGYSGGCEQHDLDAVAFTGWMKSNPAQIRVALTHDAHGDLCEAALQRSLRFDLAPLEDAWADAFGDGGATVILLVEPGAGAIGGGAIPVSYTF